MKVERFNDNKAKITLTFDELKSRKITLDDIKNNKTKAQDFFLELLEDCGLLEEFETDTNELFIEACKENNLFTVSITKISNLASSKIIPNKLTLYKISSNIYSFKTVQDIKEFANKAYDLELYLPENILYSFNNKFFIVFNKKGVNNSKFVKTFAVLSEYSDSYFSKHSFNDILNEYGTLLFKSKGAHQILEYPYFLT